MSRQHGRQTELIDRPPTPVVARRDAATLASAVGTRQLWSTGARARCPLDFQLFNFFVVTSKPRKL